MSDKPFPAATDDVSLSPIRGAVVLVLIAIAMSALVGRVAWLQTIHREQTADRVARQQHSTATLTARRGSVFDSGGLMLAGSVESPGLFIDPAFLYEQMLAKGKSLIEIDSALEQVAEIAMLDPDELILAVGRDPSKRYVPLTRTLSPSQAEAIAALDIPGVGFEKFPQRHYPMGLTAAHILGGVGRDSNGLEGIERVAEAQLAGHDGSKRVLRDKRGRPIGTAAFDLEPPQHGKHLVLTIDASIQLIAEEELAKACEEYGAASGKVVVMDPRTGDVVALANWPAYYPEYLSDSSAEARRNRALVDPYEPGSVAKPFIVAALVDQKIARLDEVLPVDGPVRVTDYGRRIRDVHPYPELAVWDVLVKSSNIGMSLLGERITDKQLHDLLSRFGFGKATDIDLPGESPGQLSPTRQWTKYSKDSIVQGYEMLITPMQLARAMCSIANGGRLVRPRIVKATIEADAGYVEQDPLLFVDAPEVLRRETADAIRRVLADAPIRGTARKARSEKYNLFGKTGTAHRVFEGKYDEQHYNASFLGGGPYERPRLVIALNITDPDKSKSHYGGLVAAPAASRILVRALEHLGVPESPELPAPPPNIAALLYQYDSPETE